MAVTIKQIAELAGVSRGTVDRVLNERGSVSPEVEKRIQRIALELNYKPNFIAKALANSQKQRTIGVVVNSGGNAFFDKVLIGISRGCKEAERFRVTTVIKELTGYDPREQLDAIETLAKNSLNALVITPINDKLIIDRLNALADSGVGIVTLNADADVQRLAFVGCDYYKSGQTAADILGQITNKKARVGIITGSGNMLGHVRRVEGFCDVVKESYPQIEIVAVCESFDDDETAFVRTKKLLKEHSELDALYFCAGGIDGGIKAVREAGREGDIRIITVDDTDNVKGYILDGIVAMTVCQQPIKQGFDAMKVAYDYVLHNKIPTNSLLLTQNEIKNRYNL